MPFQFDNQQHIGPALRRIGREQAEKAISELASAKLSQATQVHQLRKRCKRLRGLLRLVRPTLAGSFAAENSFLRDTAQALSTTRDSKTLLTAYDQLLDQFADQDERDSFSSIRHQLTQNSQHVLNDEQAVGVALTTAAQRMKELAERSSHWGAELEPHKKRRSFTVLAGGLAKTYDQARDGLRIAQAEPTPEAFHDWRKHVKYHYYHCQLLHQLWPKMIAARAAEAKRLGEWLGDDHDLAVLQTTILQAPSEFGSQSSVASFLSLIEKRRQQLERKAVQLGQHLFAEKTKRFVQRLQAYWDAYCGHTD